jgi:hypothetical protein
MRLGMRLPLNAADRFWLGLPGICLPLLTPTATCSTIQDVSQPIGYRWRGPVTDAEMVALSPHMEVRLRVGGGARSALTALAG